MLIPAPVEEVFDYVADRSHLATIWPSVIDIKDVKRLPSGGSAFQYVYKMAGWRLEGTGSDSEYVAKERIITLLTGGLEGTITFRFESVSNKQTKVRLAVVYTMPKEAFQKDSEPYVAQLNEHEAELVLRNLKSRFEVAVALPVAR
jgi:secreted protein with Ig-like and vWFA domain